MISKDTLKKAFYKTFQIQAEHTYHAPGRVNLIGEHIDYHGGYVFPAAIDLGTSCAMAIRHDTYFYVYSKQFEEDGIIKIDPKDLSYDASLGWINYISSVLYVFFKKGHVFSHGLTFYIDSDLPTASGLSSSASIEMLVAYVINDVYQFGYSNEKLALFTQEAEQTFLKVHSGIMDQLSIALGKKDHAMMMHTATLKVTHHPVLIEGYSWVIMNTNYKRTLADSKYNARVKETREASLIIQTRYPHQYVSELSTEMLNDIQHVLNDDMLYNRIKHVMTESARTHQFKHALENRDLVMLGKCLNASHQSLKEDYEVTGIHLDTIVSAAQQYAVGARMTGAGFGGCAVALVNNRDLTLMTDEVYKEYMKKTSIRPSFYQVIPSDGVRKDE